MSNRLPHLQITFTVKDKTPAAYLGAFIIAIRTLKWQTTEIAENFSIQAVTEATATGHSADLQISYQSDTTFLATLIPHNYLVPEEYLKECADNFTKEVDFLITHNLDLTLRSYYERIDDYPYLKESPSAPDNTFRWLKYFYIKNPLQPVVWIILINVIIFVLMAFDGAGLILPNAEVAKKWGAGSKQHILNGEYWRLVTACFIHFGVLHLVSNMVGLYYAGNLLSICFSRLQFVVGYLVCGIISIAFSIYWHTDTISAGASGAIFGCYGLLLGITLTPAIIATDRKVILKYLAALIGINLLVGLSALVDNAGHISGLVCGTVIGLIYALPLIKKLKKGIVYALTFAVLVLGVLTAWQLLEHTYYYYYEFERWDKKYQDAATKAFNSYNTHSASPGNELLLLKQSREQFEKTVTYADSMAVVKDAPEFAVKHAQAIKQYSLYFIQDIDYRILSYGSNGAMYYDSINITVGKIDSMQKLLHTNQ